MGIVLNSSGMTRVSLFSFSEAVVPVSAGVRALCRALGSAEPPVQHRTLSCSHDGNDFRIQIFFFFPDQQQIL